MRSIGWSRTMMSILSKIFIRIIYFSLRYASVYFLIIKIYFCILLLFFAWSFGVPICSHLCYKNYYIVILLEIIMFSFTASKFKRPTGDVPNFGDFYYSFTLSFFLKYLCNLFIMEPLFNMAEVGVPFLNSS